MKVLKGYAFDQEHIIMLLTTYELQINCEFIRQALQIPFIGE